MKKVIVKCKSCDKKMKIINKIGKYRCPYCKTVYKLNAIDKTVVTLNQNLKNISNSFDNIKNNFDNIKNSIKYRLMLSKNKKK